MKLLLVNGIYDETTLTTLKDLGVKIFGFDLRGNSLNLVSFSKLNSWLGSLTDQRVLLEFENDKDTTVLSFLNLLEHHKQNFCLVFRDARPLEYYEKINKDCFWMFDPNADWRSMLELSCLKGIFLPLKWQAYYQSIPKLWEIVENRKLEIFLHADHFSQLDQLSTFENINISVDLSHEVESSYRNVDQQRLRKMKIWRGKNESLVI